SLGLDAASRRGAASRCGAAGPHLAGVLHQPESGRHDQVHRTVPRARRGAEVSGRHGVGALSWQADARRPRQGRRQGGRRAHALAARSRLLLQRRLHQLERIVARPFGRAGQVGDLAAVGVDQQRRRHADRLADALELLKHPRAGIGVVGEPGHAGLLQPRLRLVEIAGVDVHRDHLQARSAELLLKPGERRHLLAARHAPRGPQVEQRGPALPAGKRLLGAGRVLEGERRQVQAGVGDAHRRDLAARERRDPLGGGERARAGGVAGIATEGRNPVYRRPAQCRDRSRCNHYGFAPPGRRACRGGSARHDRMDRRFANLGSSMSNKMWGGRFSAQPDAVMAEINTSIDVDRKLFRQDIAASKAHAEMLAKQGIISTQDAKKIVHGLDTILSEIAAEKFEFKRALEDIHMNVEARLADLIGPAAGRLHTARSRNDQVATDFRLWVRDALDALDAQLADYQRVLAEKALAHAGTVMPGFTHLQTAQPVTFGHHLLAYVEMVARDRGRFSDARKRLNECPLGAAALAGTSFPLDRAMTARALGFDRPAANSLDAVSDRDFALETLAAAAIAAVHLSRFAEEIVIWTSALVGLVKLSDKFTTGS